MNCRSISPDHTSQPEETLASNGGRHIQLTPSLLDAVLDELRATRDKTFDSLRQYSISDDLCSRE
jgi:hypothetical protein